MGRLIIDGNSFFEIDEECIKKKRISKQCGLEQYLKKDKREDNQMKPRFEKIFTKERGDG